MDGFLNDDWMISMKEVYNHLTDNISRKIYTSHLSFSFSDEKRLSDLYCSENGCV